MFAEVLKYSQTLLAIRQHLRSPLNPDPEGMIRNLMNHRVDNFLAHAATSMSAPDHPYAVMFKLAGCTHGDLESSVRRHGIETTLETLFEQGVYLSHDEFRCKKPIVRSGRHIPASMEMWKNPAVKGGYVQSSSGTSGRPITTRESIATTVGPYESLGKWFLRELNLAPGANLIVAPILPGGGPFLAIMAERLFPPCDRWFATGGATRRNLHYRIITSLLVREMRHLGLNVPYPIYLEHNDFGPVAEHVSGRIDAGARPVITGFVSSIARVAEAAVSQGLDLTGCLAVTLGESLSDAKRQVIQSAGITVYPTYATTDFGSIGLPCAQMTRGNCSHILQHGIALIARKSCEWTDAPVNSLYATSILPLSSRIFFNAEIGDTGVIEPATCDCSFSRLGFDLQVRDIAAINKVTAQGVTIDVSELVPLLEEALPARFGGHPGDFQLCETEAGSQTEIVLRIRPGISTAAPDDILKHFLGEVKRVYGGALSVVSWLHSEGIRVEVSAPVLAATGKFRAVRLLGVSAQRAVERKRPAMVDTRARSAAGD